ncbi:hypothetical protein [Adhaeribacter radiodurans]|uniref:DUF4468 domain-containing protein n=1 Tax=Adhaeribacter radiodurans TaxID=2745197 RepID=A0A7L7LBE1_9BACT|nr:hypothetical protein [Adhaeribacter radiodurans]QMU30151.1 hypothetical protein HUW48_19895 [Adhaeribacter radiodurans]
MTRIYTLLFVFFLSLHAFAQTKKDNTITVNTGLPASEAFTAWGIHLAANGYSIDKSDTSSFTISTGSKDTSRLNYAYIVNSSVTDSGLVVIRMKWQLKSSALAGTKATDFYDWEYATAKSNVQNIIFQDINKVIQSFGQYPVSYSVK